MPSLYAVKLRRSCPECGESTSIDGPYRGEGIELWNQLHPVRKRRLFWMRSS